MDFKRKALFFTIMTAVISVFILRGVFAQQESWQFSGNLETHTAGDGQAQKSRVYVSGHKIRTEAGEGIVIARLDKNVMWIILPAEREYIEQPMDANMMPRLNKQLENEVGRQSLGRQIVNGIEVEKFKVTYKKGEEERIMYQWLTDSGFPLKMEAADGSWGAEYSNVSFEPQADDLFEIPDGFKMSSLSLSGIPGMPSVGDVMSQIGQ